MHSEHESPYPGAKAASREVLDLAHAYYNAAIVLLIDAHEKTPVSLSPLSYAPVRLCAIHAIELYLNAFLRHEGVAPEQIRARMHNLSDPQLVTAIKLKKKTAEHLEALTNRREYLISRYGPEQVSQHTELNRLQATLKEMMMKVGKHLRSDTVRDAEL